MTKTDKTKRPAKVAPVKLEEPVYQLPEDHMLYAKQGTKVPMANGKRYFNFYSRNTTQSDKSDTHINNLKIVGDEEGYDSLEDAIAAQPLATQKIEVLKHYVAIDFHAEKGQDFPEFGVVARNSTNPLGRPFCWYEYTNPETKVESIKWVTHPQIGLILHRYRERQTTK